MSKYITIALCFLSSLSFGQSTVDTLNLMPTENEPYSELTKEDYIVESPAITITVSGATSTLSQIPFNNLTVFANINGQTINAFAGSGMVVSGTSVVFTNSVLGYSLTATDRIVFTYFKQ